MSCCASREVISESIPEDSSRPCTTSASDSCSVSNTRTSFSPGLGRTAGPSFIVPPIRHRTDKVWGPLRSAIALIVTLVSQVTELTLWDVAFNFERQQNRIMGMGATLAGHE